jgi:hypothetical protein
MSDYDNKSEIGKNNKDGSGKDDISHDDESKLVDLCSESSPEILSPQGNQNYKQQSPKSLNHSLHNLQFPPGLPLTSILLLNLLQTLIPFNLNILKH